MTFPSMNILKHAMSVHTIKAFLMFEMEFIDGAAYNFKAIESSSSAMSFEVRGIRVARESHEKSHVSFGISLILIKRKVLLNVVVRCLLRFGFCVPIA